MASLSTPNISKAFSEGNDLDTTMDRALYYEPVNHVLKKYSAFCLTEDDIARIVNKNSGDEEYLTNLLMEHHEALSILGISDIQSLYHLLLSLLTLSNPALVKGWKVPAEKDQLMEIEISEAPKIPKHQSKAAAQQEEPMSDLSAKTTPFTPKANNSQSHFKTTKKQPAATSPKTICTIMTGYVLSQLDTLNHLKAWGQVVVIKFKSQQKYVTITVSIKLNQETTRLWNDGVWTAPLGRVPALVSTATLYLDNSAQTILAPLKCKAFKLIQDQGTLKLITYYKFWTNIEKVIAKKETPLEGESKKRFQDSNN
ncbi:hypothetical protein RhiirA5_429501 [Rhizophagus irregularis]|uniref:Uncharacterized protein n=2 Tax=Rhizophagus irregularis TaxID=588596 RepID=A0A2N0NYA6_9GLOM|nr:hypothetical protein RhiirA5_429501 [Rhizophagus irregularis]